MPKLSFIVYSKSPQTRAAVTEQLVSTGRVSVYETPTDLADLAHEIDSGRAHGVYLDLDVDMDEVFDFLASMSEPRPMVLLGAEKGDSPSLLRAMRLGARDFYVGHQMIGVEAVLDEVTPRRDSSSRQAPTVAIVGVKGGVGATSLACELGISLQEAGLSTVVCDLSRRLGAVALYFDMKPRFDIADIVKHDGELDSVFVDAVLSQHSSDVSVLAAPSTYEDVTLLNAPALERVLKFLKTEFDCVVLDVPWGFDELCFRALDMSNEIAFVTAPDVVALTHARTCRRTLEQLGARSDRVHTVLNKASSDASIPERQVTEFLETELDAQIPELPESARRYTDAGLILRDVPGSEKTRKAIQDLRDKVAEWCHLELPEIETGGGNLMTRFRSLINKK